MIDFAIQELIEASSTQSCDSTRFVHLDQAIEILVASHGAKLSDHWPLNKEVEDGQADCAIESECKRRIKGWGCYDNCRSYTPAT